jgi:hypothetical protein
MSAGDESWRAESCGFGLQRAQIAPALIASIWLAFGLAMFLLVRRATGALLIPLPPLPLVATAIGLVAWVWAMRFVIWRLQIDRDTILPPRWEQVTALWLPQLTLMVFAVACSYPGRRLVDWLVWMPVVVVNSAGPQFLARWRWAHADHAGLRAAPKRRSPLANLGETTALADDSGTLLQQLSRSRAADGHATVHGTLVAEFGSGERTAALHVAFCPPFELVPHVEAETGRHCQSGASAPQWRSDRSTPVGAHLVSYHSCDRDCSRRERPIAASNSGRRRLPCVVAVLHVQYNPRGAIDFQFSLFLMRSQNYERHANRYWRGYTLP